jgi:hypothetical protein
MRSLLSTLATVLVTSSFLTLSQYHHIYVNAQTETLQLNLIQQPLENGTFIGMIEFTGLKGNKINIANVSYWTTSGEGGELFVYNGKDTTNTGIKSATVADGKSVTFTLGRVTDCTTYYFDNGTWHNSTTMFNETNHIGGMYFVVDGQVLHNILYDAQNYFTCNKFPTSATIKSQWATCPVTVSNNVYDYAPCNQTLSLLTDATLQHLVNGTASPNTTTSTSNTTKKSSAQTLYTVISPWSTVLIAAIPFILSQLM